MDVPMFLEYCANCGIPFAITVDLKEKLKKCHNTFYCPNGHGQHYTSKSDEEKLKDKVREKEAEISRLQTELYNAKNPPKKRKPKK